jgi:hypothetical protein
MRIGVYYAVAFGLVGTAAAWGLLETSGGTSLVVHHWSGAIGAVAAGLATAWCLGSWAAPQVITMPMPNAALLGSIAGVVSLTTAIVIGFPVQLIANQISQSALERSDAVIFVLLKPMYLALLLGLVPAATLGGCCGLALRWALGRPTCLQAV